jgi:iron(III) transport system ATP-binding protein
MVFQSYALWPHMSVERNVSFGLEVRSVPRAEREASVRRALEQVRLDALASRKPGQLSGGQQQRVALARALVVRPRVLLLDEPLSNLDAALRSEMRGEIRRLCNEAGLTALYVTHDQHEAMAVADRIALLDAGRVAQVGTPRQIYTQPANRFAAEFMGRTNIIEARVSGLDPATLDTAIGTLAAGHLPGGLGEGDAALLSVRPEAWRRGPGTRGVRGRVRLSAFLGDHAEYEVSVGDGVTLSVTEQGSGAGVPATGDEVDLHVDPRDVVVLPGGAVETG